ncbi:MAG: pyridoxal phosphate-dependent aminotransferase [Bacteriovoracaceae bacterium]
MKEFSFAGNSLIPTEISKLRLFSAKARPDTLNLGLGKPYMDTPPELKKLAKELIDKSALDYSDNAGTPALREAIGKKFNLKASEVCVTHGAQEALMCTLMGLLNDGDEVLIPDPGFVAYQTMVQILGGKATAYPLTWKEGEFVYDIDQILERVTERTRIVMLGRISNPTGSDLSPIQLVRLARQLKEKDIIIITDEVYAELNFFEFYQPGTCLTDNIIAINSLSKSHALTGWRLGYVLCRMEPLMKKIIVAHQYIGTCATRLSQNLAEKIFVDDVLYNKIVQNFKEHYRNGLDLFLKTTELPLKMPRGSFYLFPRIPDKFKTDYEFAEELLARQNMLVIPGSVFGALGTRHVRLALSLETHKIKQAADTFKHYY